MKSRRNRFITGLFSGYALVFANIAYTALSIPLALHYLGKEGFGLWAIALQVLGYFMLVDLGVSTAVSRLLANHKDAVNGGDYGSLLLTGSLTFFLQGMILSLGGAALSFLAPGIFKIPADLAVEFRNVLIILSVVGGVSIATRAITAPLWAFQRLDLVYGFGIITQLGSLLFLYWGFAADLGIYSLAFAGIIPLLLCTTLGFFCCLSLGYYPSPSCWGKPQWRIFRATFSFAKDVMLMAIGSQIVNASQLLIIGRYAGLEAAATFAVGTKFYMLGSQLTGRILESASPALTEIFVRNDRVRLAHRFVDIFRSSLLLATMGAIILVIMNSALVTWWTSARIFWKPEWDTLLGLTLLVTTCSRCLVGLFGVAANLRPVRHIYLAEGVVFIAFAVPSTTNYGIFGLLAASLVAHLIVTVFFSTIAAKRMIGPLGGLHKPLVFSVLLLIGAASVDGWLPPIQTPFGIIAFAVIGLGFSLLAGAGILDDKTKAYLWSRTLCLIGAGRK